MTGVAVNGISATAGGVWVALATRMLGGVEFHRASELRPVAAFGPQRNGPATNGIKADVEDGILWSPTAWPGRSIRRPRNGPAGEGSLSTASLPRAHIAPSAAAGIGQEAAWICAVVSGPHHIREEAAL